MAAIKKAKTTTKKSAVKKTTAKKSTIKKTTTKSATKQPAKSKSTTKPAAIIKDMTIADAVNTHPETAFVMMKHGLHCVGCHVASWETIEQGAMGHGMDDKKVKAMVDEMNKAVEMMEKKK